MNLSRTLVAPLHPWKNVRGCTSFAPFPPSSGITVWVVVLETFMIQEVEYIALMEDKRAWVVEMQNLESIRINIQPVV